MIVSGTETIVALSSGAVPSGVAVIRVSGPEARNAVLAMTGREPPSPGSFQLRSFRDGDDLIDRGLLLWFEGPHSFTGEDVAEFHTHGGRAVVDGLLAGLTKLAGVRFATAGEFSKQALLNGRLDLTAVEGLGDLIAAQTEMQRRQALDQLGGNLERLYEGWRQHLLRSLAHVEAEIDFSDEDLPPDLAASVLSKIEILERAIESHLADGNLGERLRDGFRVALYGPPNAGKSSLLNRLAGRDVAIVSDKPGTTRDFIEVHLNLRGVPVTLVDTAGIRSVQEEVERLGVKRGLDQIKVADLRVLVIDAVLPERTIPVSEGSRPDLVVLNKGDLLEDGDVRPSLLDPPSMVISVKEDTGIDDLLDHVGKTILKRLEGRSAEVPTRLRHRESLDRCCAALSRVHAAPPSELALVAEEIRTAAAALGEITGRVGVEDMLDIVFLDFCIGK